MCLVNNMSLGPVEAITGEKSLPALTTGVLRRQVFGWVIKWLDPVSEEKSRGQRTNDLCANGSDGGGDVVFPVQTTKKTHEIENITLTTWSEQIPPMPLGLVWDAMRLFYLFLAGLQTSLFSLETASVLSHSNLKIEMSLLGSIAVMAATSFGLFNCAVNIWRWEIFCSCLLSFWALTKANLTQWFLATYQFQYYCVSDYEQNVCPV